VETDSRQALLKVKYCTLVAAFSSMGTDEMLHLVNDSFRESRRLGSAMQPFNIVCSSWRWLAKLLLM